MTTTHASTIAKPSRFCDSREGMKKLEDALSSDDMMHAPLHEVERMILRLRALRASGDFDDYWSFHLANEYERTHQSRYTDNIVPSPLPPRRPRLRLVQVIVFAPLEPRYDRAVPFAFRYGAVR